MERISYKQIEEVKYDGYILKQGREKVIQFGEGNFLRGFVDHFIDIINEKADFAGKVVVVQPISAGHIEDINQQDGLYTLYLRGSAGSEIVNEKRIISCISRGLDPYQDYDAFLRLAGDEHLKYIISNTTEAGIVYDKTCRFDDQPPASFPAKLTRLLYEKYVKSGGGNGFIILSCELIDDNGKKLKECVLKHSEDWKLSGDFQKWLEAKNLFCSILVDRIVTGYPGEDALELNRKNGYEDPLMDTAEPFGLWVIEGSKDLEERLPFTKAGLPILVTENHKPHKIRKVRILNGAHTCLVPIACLTGQTIVRESIKDRAINQFIKDLIYEEVLPTIDLPDDELRQFAEAVFDRFANPFIDHRLQDIALNSISKWNARIKPSLKDYIEITGRLPEHIVLAFAALLVFYKKGGIRDDQKVVEFFRETAASLDNEKLIDALLQRKDFFQEDLSLIKGLSKKVSVYVNAIEHKGMKNVLDNFVRSREDEMDKNS